MTLFQALLIGLFAYLGSKRTPWFFGVTGGWNMIGRPLVAGLIVGIILGDVTGFIHRTDHTWRCYAGGR